MICWLDLFFQTLDQCCITHLFPPKSKKVHHTRLWHNKKLAGLLLDNDIGVPKLPHELLSNGGPSGGLVSWVLDSSAGWKPFLDRLCLRQSAKTNWDHPGSKVCRGKSPGEGDNYPFNTSLIGHAKKGHL